MFFVPCASAADITLDVLTCKAVYNGEKRTSQNTVYLYGDVGVNGYVEYAVNIPADGTYRLDATYGLQGDKEYTHIKVETDGILQEEVTRLKKTSTKWQKQETTLNGKMPFQTGQHMIRMYLCGQDIKSGVVLYELALVKIGEYQPAENMATSAEINVVAPTNIYDGEVREKNIYLYGNNGSYSWVEYPVTIPKENTYRLVSNLAVSGGDTAELHIAIDGVKMEETAIIPAYDTSWVNRDVVLNEEILLSEGMHTLRIYQAEKKSGLLVNNLQFVSDNDDVVLYHVDDGCFERKKSADEAGTYLIKYAENRANDGMMIVCTYQNNKMISYNMENFVSGKYDVLAELNSVPKDSVVKVFFWQDFVSLKPSKESVFFGSVKRTTPRNLYVSSKGTVNGDGTQQKPFATIEQAQETIRTFGEFSQDVSVYIASGEYHLDEPLRFTEEDGGNNGFNVIYRALDKNDPPLISGGTKIENWSVWKGNIYKAKTAIKDTRTLYIDQNPAIRARSKYLYEATEMLDSYIRVPKVNFPGSFAHPEELELVWPINFTLQRIPAESIAYKETYAEISLRQSAYSVAMSNTNSYTRPDKEQPFYLENALELLDEPGEFYFDKTTQEIYYYPFPEENLATASVYAGTTDFLVNVSGSSVQKKVKNLIFDSLQFSYGSWNEVTNGPFGVSVVQADSIRTDKTASDTPYGSNTNRQGRMIPAQFSVEKADNIQIKNCIFSCLGSNAISMENAVSNSKISGNQIVDVSGSGIVLGHWNHVNQEKLDVGMERCRDIEVSNNIICRAATEFMNCCGISVYYTNGVNIHHNEIRELPYTGISLGWGWGLETIESFGNNRIMNNRIEDVTGVLDDGAHIYTLGASYGNVISGNYLLKSGDFRGGIYLDQNTSGVTVSENVTEECLNWLNARKDIKLDNTVVQNNFFDENAKYSWVTGKYNKDNELGDVVNNETVYDQRVCYNTYQNNTRMTSTRPQKAEEIIASAGLEVEYQALRDAYDRPSWRTDFRTKVPSAMYLGTNGWHEAEDFNPVEGVGYLRRGTSMPDSSYPYREDVTDVPFVPINYWGIDNFAITNTQDGDWFTYNYTVEQAGTYDVKIRLANGGDTSYLDVYVDDQKRISNYQILNTGAYQTYQTFNLGKVSLAEGEHVIKFKINQTGLHLDRWSLFCDTLTESDPGYDEIK